MEIKNAPEMQAIENWAINTIGIPCAWLMEAAGLKVAEFILKEMKNVAPVTTLAYKGNNSGDGFVCARHLHCAQLPVRVFLFCKTQDLKEDVLKNLEILKKLKVPVIEIHNEAELKAAQAMLAEDEIVVDAIFGIGFAGDFIGYPARMMDYINKGAFRRIAIDVPSGVNATTGEASVHTFKADYTITFSYPKIGLLRFPAINYTGRLMTVNIGMPQKGAMPFYKAKKPTDNPEIIDLNMAKGLLPMRKNNSHKGDYGKVLIVAGSKNMSGAAIMAALSAARSGAGLVYLAMPGSMQKSIALQIPSIITYGLHETPEGTLSARAVEQILTLCRNAEVIAIGPGLSDHLQTKAMVIELVSRIRKAANNSPVILDADALNAIAEKPATLKALNGNYIITPHAAEMSRLTNKTVSVIQKQREKIALHFAKKNKAVVLLKGAFSVIAGPKNEKYINLSGNPGMATAGAGDVLLGMLAAYVARKIPLIQATALAAFIHGLAGDVAEKIQGEESLIATDIIEAIPLVLKSIKG